MLPGRTDISFLSNLRFKYVFFVPGVQTLKARHGRRNNNKKIASKILPDCYFRTVPNHNFYVMLIGGKY